MTCTFSEKENEDVLRWLMKKFPQFTPHRVPALAGRESRLADFPCYRLWPYEEGAGAFTAILRNTDEETLAGAIDLEAAHVVWRSGVLDRETASE
jgi:hypothetical protein